MTPKDRKNVQNTREFLPPTQRTRMVPMTAEEFQRQRRRKFGRLAAIAFVVLLIAGLAMWWSSTPSEARNEFLDAQRQNTEGKYREAVESLDKAIAGEVNLFESYQLRASLHRVLGEPEKAIADATKAIELRADVADNYRLRAKCQHELGRYQKAIEDYDRLIQLQPSAEAYNGRGICYRDLGQPLKAIPDLSKSVDLEPSVDNLLQRGMAYASIGEHKKAIGDYDRVVELRPEMPNTYRARATSKEAVGDRAGAKADRDKARKIELPTGSLTKPALEH